MTQRPQPRDRPLEHRDPERPQPRRRGLVHRRRQVGQDGDRLVGARQQPFQGLRERLVPVVLLHQVHRQRHGPHPGVVRQHRERVAEEVLGVGATAPHVEGVGRLQPGIQQCRQPLDRRRRQLRERHPEPLGHVGHQHPFGPRVVHGRQAAPARRARPPGDGERLQAVGELGEVEAAVHAVRREECLPAGVRARDRTGMRVHQGLAAHRRADRERHHGDVAGGRLGQPRLQTRRVTHGLEHQPDHAGLGQRQRVGEVVGGGADQLLARRHDHRVLQPAVRAQQCREDRPGVGHERDRPGRQRVTLEVADGPDAGGGVHEPHAAATHHRHLAGRLDDLRLDAVRRAVDDRARVTPGCGDREGRCQGRVRDAEQHQVDRLRDVVKRRHARLPEHHDPGTAPGVGDPLRVVHARLVAGGRADGLHHLRVPGLGQPERLRELRAEQIGDAAVAVVRPADAVNPFGERGEPGQAQARDGRLVLAQQRLLLAGRELRQQIGDAVLDRLAGILKYEGVVGGVAGARERARARRSRRLRRRPGLPPTPELPPAPATPPPSSNEHAPPSRCHTRQR